MTRSNKKRIIRQIVKAFYALLIITVSSCTKDWDNHYKTSEDSVNIKLWDAVKSNDKYSEFIKYIELYKLDTIVNSPVPKTLFIPDNDAFSELFLKHDTAGLKETMAYHIVPSFFMMRNIENNSKKRIETLLKKLVLIQNDNSRYLIDGIEITYSSPAFSDGKYYEIEKVVLPKPNLYEYLKLYNPVFYKYIKSLDSLVLDIENSKPVGFNDKGETVYSDSVTYVVNLFEKEYFPISTEFKTIAATMILPSSQQYDDALDRMCLNLGGDFQSKEDIPVSWQENILVPILLDQGTFGGLIDQSYFNKEIITNVKGDTIDIDYTIDPASLKQCSNGWNYSYLSFSVKDSLYLQSILEPEKLVGQIGTNRYAWTDEVKIEGNVDYQPLRQEVLGASNDHVVTVNFDKNFNGQYDVTMTMKDVFPLKYRLVWRTQYRTSGVFSIYVNGKRIPLGLFQTDEFDTENIITDGGFYSVRGLGGDYIMNYPDSRGFCDVDGYVDNLTDFGDVEIKLEYKGPGQGVSLGLNSGLSIDYIGLLPAPELK